MEKLCDRQDDGEIDAIPGGEDDDELFQFCLDQLFYGTYENSLAALECLGDEDSDKTSLFHDVVNNKKAQQESFDPKQPSTSQGSHISGQLKQKDRKTQKQLYNCRKSRKYREALKKNPVKYAKALQKMKAYYKQRWQQMSQQEKQAFRMREREYNRKYYNNLATEKKQGLIQKNRQQRSKNIKNDKAKLEKKRASDRKYKAQHKSKFVCKFADCGKVFAYDHNLAVHERIHLDIKPFACTWLNCAFSSGQRSTVTKHVRTVHFKLPRNKQQQTRIDGRNPDDHIRVDEELAKRRL